MALQHRLATGVALLAAALVPSVASAGFTTWSASVGEPTVFEILDDVYGLENLERIHDFDAPDTDEVWSNDGDVRVSIIAKYSSIDQRLGILSGETGKSYTELLATRGVGRVHAEAVVDAGTSGSRFRFITESAGHSAGISRMSDNYLGEDRMVSWRVVGNAGHGDNVLGAMVVAFEDETARTHKADYNDLIFQVLRDPDGTPGDDSGTEPVPEPATLILLGMGAAGLAAARRRRR